MRLYNRTHTTVKGTWQSSCIQLLFIMVKQHVHEKYFPDPTEHPQTYRIKFNKEKEA